MAVTPVAASKRQRKRLNFTPAVHGLNREIRLPTVRVIPNDASAACQIATECGGPNSDEKKPKGGADADGLQTSSRRSPRRDSRQTQLRPKFNRTKKSPEPRGAADDGTPLNITLRSDLRGRGATTTSTINFYSLLLMNAQQAQADEPMKRVIAAKIIRGILEPDARGRCKSHHFDEATIMARKYSKAASKSREDHART